VEKISTDMCDLEATWTSRFAKQSIGHIRSRVWIVPSSRPALRYRLAWCSKQPISTGF